MPIWSLIAAREAALLAILLLLGSGPASLLPRRTDPAARIALAPLLGFCLGTCVTTTILQFAPVNSTYWALIVLAVVSVAVAVVRWRRCADHRLPRRRDLAALAVVIVAVVGPLDGVLTERHSTGPAAYYFTDGDNYVAVQDAARTVSLHAAVDAWHSHGASVRAFGNMTQFVWAFFAQFGSNLDATPLASNVNALLGLGAIDTYDSFLTVLLLMGALGAFASVRHFARGPTLTATLAAVLFGGALFLELWFDTYQAALIAIGLVVPFFVLVDLALQARSRAVLVLTALVLATMLSVYPLYIALLIGTAVVMVAARGVVLRRAGTPLRPLLRPFALSIVAVAALSLAFDPIAVLRDVHYYGLVLNNEVPYPRVSYTLPLDVLPGWISQTREFWALPGLTTGGFKQILLGVLLPLAFLGYVAVGLRRYPRALALVAMAAICAVAAEYSYVSQQSCTYCAERVLLPFGPIAAVLIALGVCAVVASHSRWWQAAGAIGVLLVLVPVAQRARIELIRFANDSYFLDRANAALLSRVPSGRGAIEEEGYGASVAAQAEQPLVYHLINERAPGRVSIVLGSDAGNAIQYLDFGPPRLPPGPEFNPRYRYVLTRLAAVATDRRTIARRGGIALEERTQPLDITPFDGLAVPLERLGERGVAWVQGQTPLRFYVAGYGGSSVWGRLTFRTTVPVSVPRQPGVRTRLSAGTLTACVRATGQAPTRQVQITIKADVTPGPVPRETFPPGMPLEGLALTSMRALTGGCTV